MSSYDTMLTVPCPKCGAKVGELCMTKNKFAALYPHTQRVNDAFAAISKRKKSK